MSEVEIKRVFIKESFWYNPYSDEWTLKKHYSVTTEQTAFNSSEFKENEENGTRRSD